MTVFVDGVARTAVLERLPIEAANDGDAAVSTFIRVIHALRRLGREVCLADFTHLSATLNWRG